MPGPNPNPLGQPGPGQGFNSRPASAFTGSGPNISYDSNPAAPTLEGELAPPGSVVPGYAAAFQQAKADSGKTQLSSTPHGGPPSMPNYASAYGVDKYIASPGLNSAHPNYGAAGRFAQGYQGDTSLDVMPNKLPPGVSGIAQEPDPAAAFAGAASGGVVPGGRPPTGPTGTAADPIQSTSVPHGAVNPTGTQPPMQGQITPDLIAQIADSDPEAAQILEAVFGANSAAAAGGGGGGGGGGGAGGGGGSDIPDWLKDALGPGWEEKVARALNTADQLQQNSDLFGSTFPESGPGGAAPWGATTPRTQAIEGQIDADLLGDPFELVGKPTATYLGLSRYRDLAEEQLGRAQDSESLFEGLRDSYANSSHRVAGAKVAQDLAQNPYPTSSPELKADLERRALEDVEQQRLMGRQRLGDTGQTRGTAGTEAQLALEGSANRARTDTTLSIDDEFARRRGEDITRTGESLKDLGETEDRFYGRPTAALSTMYRQPLEPYRETLADLYTQLGTQQSEKSLALRGAPAIDYAGPIIGAFAGGAARSIFD